MWASDVQLYANFLIAYVKKKKNLSANSRIQKKRLRLAKMENLVSPGNK